MTDVYATLGSQRRLRSHLAAEITRRRSHRRRIPGASHVSSSASALAPPGPSPVPGPGVPGHAGFVASHRDGWVRPHANHGGAFSEEDLQALRERARRYRGERQQLGLDPLGAPWEASREAAAAALGLPRDPSRGPRSVPSHQDGHSVHELVTGGRAHVASIAVVEQDARRAALEERLLRYRADRQQLLDSFYQAYNTTPDEGAVLAARQRLEERLRAAGIRGRQEPEPSAPSDRHHRGGATAAAPAGRQPGGAPGQAGRQGGAGGVSGGPSSGGGFEWWRRLLGSVSSSGGTAENKPRLLSRSGLLSLSRPDSKGEGDAGGAVPEGRQDKDSPGAFHKDEGRDCSVCLDRLAQGEPLLWLPCAHGFHTDCLQPWLALGHNSCPYCRQEF